MAHDDRTRSPAERIAVEVFVYLMQRSRVRHYDIAIHCVTRRITHHAFSGPKHEIVRRHYLAPPFWPLTIDRREAVRTGYGLNRHAVWIRYKQNAYSTNSFHDGGIAARWNLGRAAKN